MTRSETKQWLSRYRDLLAECNKYKDQTLALRQTLDGVGAQRLTGMPSGSKERSDLIERKLDKIHKLEKQWDRCFDQMTDALAEIDRTIGMVPGSKLRVILRLRYIDGCTFSEIARFMNYSVQNIYKLFNKALDEISKRVE